MKNDVYYVGRPVDLTNDSTLDDSDYDDVYMSYILNRYRKSYYKN